LFILIFGAAAQLGTTLLAESPLLQTYQLNPTLSMQNRIVMAPMTRCSSTQDHVPTEAMVGYYSSRGDAGMIISEATMVDKDATGYPCTPGVYNSVQIEAWKKIVDQVHQKGGLFFVQLWHAGMMSHPIYREGKTPIASSKIIPLNKKIPRTEGSLEYGYAKEMDLDEIQQVKETFIQAALNARKAGFNGVELHAANGYLIDEFLHYNTNHRTDRYGGSPEKMVSFLLEIVDGIVEKISKDRVGVRLSPIPLPSMNNLVEDSRDEAVFSLLLRELEKRKIAYVHLSSDNDVKDCGFLNRPVTTFIREHYKGTLIGCGSYTIETAEEAINKGQFDLIAFGRLFISNPFLIQSIRNGETVNNFNPADLQSLK